MHPDEQPTKGAAPAHDRDEAGAGRAFDDCYRELHALAQAHLRAHGDRRLLQTTALVNEVWLKLSGRAASAPQDREHLLAVAARAMRSVLVDQARRNGSLKRGGDRDRIPLEAGLSIAPERMDLVLAIDELLDRLAERDEDLARIAELRLFGGLQNDEIAATVGRSLSTVERSWRTARAWLQRELCDEEST